MCAKYDRYCVYFLADSHVGMRKHTHTQRERKREKERERERERDAYQNTHIYKPKYTQKKNHKYNLKV